MLQIVMSPIEGGPAERAGIISGDELVSIDGKWIDNVAHCGRYMACFLLHDLDTLLCDLVNPCPLD
jgi:hypothetical protein